MLLAESMNSRFRLKILSIVLIGACLPFGTSVYSAITPPCSSLLVESEAKTLQLVELGFDAQIAHQILENEPETAEKILFLNSTNARAVTVYRGVIADPRYLTPNIDSAKSSQYGGTFFTTAFSRAYSYAFHGSLSTPMYVVRSRTHGTLIEAQMPYYLTQGRTDFVISQDNIRSLAPFIRRLGIIDRSKRSYSSHKIMRWLDYQEFRQGRIDIP